MQPDWKAAFAARHRDVLVDSHADGMRWRPLRQSAAVDESLPAWRWLVLGVVVLHLLLASLLSLLTDPPTPVKNSVTPLIVEYIEREAPAAASPPPVSPSAPALRPQQNLSAPPIPDLPAENMPVDRQAADSEPLPAPTSADLLRMLPYSAKSADPLDDSSLLQRNQARLPGRAEAFVEGIHLRGRPSPEQRVQFVLGLVGLGRPDPCPDTRRHIADALRAEHNGKGIDGELELWLTRGERCPR